MNDKAGIAEVVIYATRYCPHCIRARRLLDAKRVCYRETLVDTSAGSRREMERRTGRRTVPQIFFGGRHVGGFDSLLVLETTGELDRLLSADPLAGCA